MRLLKNGGALKSLYELCFLNSYVVDIVKLIDHSRAIDIDVLKKDFEANGLSLRQISKKYNRHRSVIRKTLVESGVKKFCHAR